MLKPTYLATSFDGGQTWYNAKVSDISHTTEPISGDYAGDYIGLAAYGGTTYPAWMDDRNGTWQIYVSPVTLVKPPLSVSIGGPSAMNSGDMVAFSSSVSHEEGPVSYQWYYRTSPSQAWTTATGETDPNFTHTFYNSGGYPDQAVKVEVSSAGETTSDVHSITVAPCSRSSSSGGTIQPNYVDPCNQYFYLFNLRTLLFNRSRSLCSCFCFLMLILFSQTLRIFKNPQGFIKKQAKFMFTGIIKEVGKVKEITQLDGGFEFAIQCDLAQQVAIDQSISINGVCHTVTAVDDSSFLVQSVEETLRKTTIGGLKEGDEVNLEPSLHPQQLLDGHLVQGHVDSTGTISSINQEGTDWLFSIDYAKQYKDLIVGRGSIAINGISLTVADLSDENFTVAIVPYTYENTNLKRLKAGDKVNLEFDILGKYVVRYLKNREG